MWFSAEVDTIRNSADSEARGCSTDLISLSTYRNGRCFSLPNKTILACLSTLEYSACEALTTTEVVLIGCSANQVYDDQVQLSALN